MRLSYAVQYVPDINRTIQFYEKAFELKHQFTHESGDYAEMSTGEATLAFCSHDLATSLLKEDYVKADASHKPLGIQITLEPENVTKAFNVAVGAGATIISKPEIKPWNFEVAILRDCNGHIVELTKAL